MTSPKPTPTHAPVTAPEPTKQTRERSEAAKAAAAYSKLEAIDADEIAELAQSPQAIKAKHHARRQKVIEGLPEEARRLVEKMRLPDA